MKRADYLAKVTANRSRQRKEGEMMSKKSKTSERNSENSPSKKRSARRQRLVWNEGLGDRWPGLSLPQENGNSPTKDFVVRFLSVSFVVLLFALAAYAMATDDKQTLIDIRNIVKAGLVGVGVWSTGNFWKNHTKDQ